jgi:hypothetical protein
MDELLSDELNPVDPGNLALRKTLPYPDVFRLRIKKEISKNVPDQFCDL